MGPVTVINGDIKASRKMQRMERYEWQLFMKSTIVQLNEQYSELIEAPFMITKGDEFQGVIRRMSDVDRIICKIEQLIYPLQVRFGVGYGNIHKMGSKIPIEMDGPAFHRASEALNAAKQKKRFVWFCTGDDRFDLAANTIYLLIFAIKSKWRKNSFTRYWKYKEMGTYERVASSEGVSAQAIWDTLHQARAIEVIEAEKAVEALLKQRENFYLL
ncbi:SatD family protein [Caldithrix abyssi]